MANDNFDWGRAHQLNLLQIFAAFAIPSAIAFIGFRFVLAMVFERGIPAIVAWPAIACVMLLAFTIVPVLLMKREATQLNISLKSRMCLRKITRREWGFALIVLILGVIAAMGMAGASAIWGDITGLTVPAYYPFFLDPSINPMATDLAELTPGFELQGAYWLVALMLITLLLNILVEELYFRAWLLPKMQALGAASWALNGFGFAFYHTFQLWLLPQILPLSLFMAFVVYKTKSIWPAFIIHLLVNSLTAAAMIMLVIS